MSAALPSDASQTPALALVHGWMHSSRVWGPLVRALPADWRVACANLDGFGGLPGIPGKGLSCLDQLACSLLERIRPSTIGASPAICAGDSLGAIVLLRLALDGGLSTPLYLLGAPAYGLPPWLSLPGSAALVGPALRLLRALPTSLALAPIGWASRLTFARVTEHRELLLEMASEADPRTARETLSALQGLKAKPLSLRELFQPCRVVRGEKDRLVDKSATHRLAEALGADVDEIPGAGHTPMLENPRALAESLVRFHQDLARPRDTLSR